MPGNHETSTKETDQQHIYSAHLNTAESVAIYSAILLVQVRKWYIDT